MAGSIFLIVDGDATETTLDSFLDHNSFEPSEVADMRRALAWRGVYRGGGGAAPEWMICTLAYLRSEAA